MAGPWDSMTKRMIGANPEHFVKWLDAEAVFVAALDIELKSQHIFWDLLAISQLLGGLAFKQGPEREWFKRRFSMFQDILQESWVYQEIGQQFHEEGRIQEQHEMLKSFLQLRFPETLALANQQTNNIKDPAVLRAVLTKL